MSSTADDILKTILITWLIQRLLLFSTDQSSGASTALGKGSVIGLVTQNPARRINQPLERCCAVSLTPCRTTMSSTSGFLWLTHVSGQNLNIQLDRRTDTHMLVTASLHSPFYMADDLKLRLYVSVNRGQHLHWKALSDAATPSTAS